MPHQEELTVIAKIDPDRMEELERRLGTIAARGGRDWELIPFSKLGRVHFAGLFILPESELDGERLSAQLVLMTNVDAPLAAHVEALADVAGSGLDTVFGCCEGYPQRSRRTPSERARFLKEHRAPAQVFYVNRQGRSVEQILAEDALRVVIEAHLDSQNSSNDCAACVRDSIVNFVQAQPDLRWALSPAAPPCLAWRLEEAVDRVARFAAVVLLCPAALAIAPLVILALRRHERSDVPDERAAAPGRIRDLREDEDYGVQNQIVAAGALKRGRFRRRSTRAILQLANYFTRHIYNRGSLSGLNTIHFARWVAIDEGRRLFFVSNYDGSLESYMNDFIDKAAWGLNAIFSSGEGFPRTAFLFCLGITDEIAYKRFLPTRQLRMQVWYSAYPHLTTKNVANNAEIRRGLSARMQPADVRVWLRRFGAGNILPQPGIIARLLDSIRWDVACRACK